MAGKFEVYQDKNGEFRFRLKASNKKIIATGHSYKTKKGNLFDSEYELIKDYPYWWYKALNDSKELKQIAKYVLYHHKGR